MEDEMVLRSVNLWTSDDNDLRQLAFDRRISKSDLIRAAIRAKLREWRQSNTDEILREDLERAKRP